MLVDGSVNGNIRWENRHGDKVLQVRVGEFGWLDVPVVEEAPKQISVKPARPLQLPWESIYEHSAEVNSVATIKASWMARDYDTLDTVLVGNSVEFWSNGNYSLKAKITQTHKEIGKYSIEAEVEAVSDE